MNALLAGAAGLASAAIAAALLDLSLLSRRTRQRVSRMAGGSAPPGLGSRVATSLAGRFTAYMRTRALAGLREAAEKALDDVLMEVAESLRAGESLLQALQRTADSSQGVWRELLGEVLARYDQGLPLPEAARALDRLGSRYISLFVRSIHIHQRTGGDLAEVLVRLAETVRDHRLFEGDLRARTAESRWTAYFVAATPFLLLLYFAVAAPGMLFPLLAHPAGRAGLLYALASWAAGLAVLRRLTRFSY